MTKYWRRKLEFPKITQKHNCGGSTVPSGSPAHEDTLFFEGGNNLKGHTFLSKKLKKPLSRLAFYALDFGHRIQSCVRVRKLINVDEIR